MIEKNGACFYNCVPKITISKAECKEMFRKLILHILELRLILDADGKAHSVVQCVYLFKDMLCLFLLWHYNKNVT